MSPLNTELSAADYERLRDRMVAEQIEARGIRDPRVLRAMAAVPRHLFVAADQQRYAYDDRPLPIGEGQTISQPYMVAVMTEALELGAGNRVLEVGTGSGYQAAVLASLAGEIFSVERRSLLASRARETLVRLGLPHVTVIEGDGSMGLPHHQPFDAIVVTAGAPTVPDVLCRQLADGGRLVIPVGPATHQELLVVRRDGPTFRQWVREECVFVPLIGQHGWHQ